MKTSEFIDILKSKDLKVEINDDSICVGTYDKWFEIGDIDGTEPYLKLFEHKVFRKSHDDILSAIVIYINTPLEERKEEKKYFLRVPFTDDLYLNCHKNLKSYALSDKFQSRAIQTRFTKEEIDAMPFDTDFFIKEEVK